jgi:hypothetical protein
VPYTPVIGDNPSTKPDAAWTPQWTTDTTGTSCSSSTNFTDLKFYRCYAANGAYSATAYADLKSTVKAALLADPGNNHTANDLVTAIDNVVKKANTSDAAGTPTNTDYTSRRWVVTVAPSIAPFTTCTPATSTTGPVTTTVPAPISASTDPLFGNIDGQQSVTTQNATTCLTATVTLQVGTCSALLVLGACVGTKVWGNGSPLLGGGLSIPQFQMIETVKAATATTSTTLASSQFPIATDVTPYAMPASATSGPGDLYVEGTATASMALIAQNDVVVTNSLAASGATNGLEIIAQNNVRAYHPVKCTSVDTTAVAATTVGFCPNDITGLYSGVLATAARPDQQYTNLAPSVTDLGITAAIFALGNAPTTLVCPRPSSGGICGGEITTDNYNRGNALGTLTVTGGAYMAHHGPVGQEWEIAATAGQSSRPNSGYQYTGKYLNLAAALAGFSTILQTTSTSPFYWRVLSVSTGS